MDTVGKFLLNTWFRLDSSLAILQIWTDYRVGVNQFKKRSWVLNLLLLVIYLNQI